MPTSLSSRIAKHFSVTHDARRTAREMKVSLHNVRAAVYAWRVIETMGPLLKDANRIIHEIDSLGPPSDCFAREGVRLREERKRHGITLNEAAHIGRIPAMALGAIERGKLENHKGRRAYEIAKRISMHRITFDAAYVLHGRRGEK